MNLSTEQRAAVESPAAHKRVLAGAGSGKTRLLVGQVARWIAEGVRPSSIAAITFTRRAGEELRKRVASECGQALGYVGTVHGMAYLAMALACDGKWRVTPLADEECDAVAAYVAAECNLKIGLCPRVRAAARGESFDPDRMHATQIALLRMVQAYMTRHALAHVGLMVDILVARCLAAPELLEWLRANARYVVWDEFQDADAAEAELLRLLRPRRSVVVGDPRQAIYGFRGADSSHLRTREAETWRLRVNYRSGARILQAADRAMPDGLRLVPFRRDAGDVAALPAGPDDLGPLVAWLAEAQKPVHVLCRTNREVALLARVLEATGHDCAIASPGFDRFAKAPWTGLSLACRAALNPGCPWLAAALDDLGLPAGPLLLDPWHVQAGELLASYSPAEAEEVACEPAAALPVAQFLAWHQRRDVQDLLPREPAGITLMTAHASKGLEFEAVALSDVGRRLGGDDAEDERNLLYVAATRAKDRLALSGDPTTTLRLAGTDEEAP